MENHPTTLLFLDDDAEVLEINRKFFEKEGYRVLTESNPIQGIALARRENPQVILLDVMMPEMDGFAVCSALREFSDAPILFVTGRSGEEDKLKGLLNGGDDYIVKPYSLKELAARICVILRRSQKSPSPAPSPAENQLVLGDLCLDLPGHKALFKGEDLLLSNREYDVLYYMATHPNQDVTFQELGLALFGTYQENDRKSVMVNMSRLRKKMSIDLILGETIETVWSKGYRFSPRA